MKALAASILIHQGGALRLAQGDMIDRPDEREGGEGFDASTLPAVVSAAGPSALCELFTNR